MSLRTMLPSSVVISTYSQGAANSHGVPEAFWIDQSPVKGRLQQVGSSETTQGAQEAISDWLLILPSGTPLTARDRVTVDGVTFEVVGPPSRPFGRTREHHVEARLRAVNP